MSRGLSLSCLSLSRAPISPRTKIRGRAELLSFPAPQLADPVDIPYRINMIVNQAEGYGAAPFGGGFAVLADNLLLHPVTKDILQLMRLYQFQPSIQLMELYPSAPKWA